MVGHQRLYQYFDTIIWICLPICIFYFAYVNNLLHNSLYYEMSPLELMIPIYLSKMMYRFWWLGVYKDVWCFLQTCPKCQTYSIVQSLNITTSNTQLAPLHVHYRLLRCQAQRCTQPLLQSTLTIYQKLDVLALRRDRLNTSFSLTFITRMVLTF